VVEVTTHCDSDLPDAVLARLAGMPKLQRLGLVGGQSLTDEGIGHIGEMKGLVELELRNKVITAAGIKRVASLPRLRKLSLWNVRMTDEIYRELEACRSLEVLVLRNVSGSPSALQSLARCPKLKRIDTFRCGGVFDPAADEQTRKALPGV
jgi:hypothetical protein